MKTRHLFFFVLLLGLFVASAGIAQTPLLDADYPKLSVHRGGPAPGYPENCLSTFKHTLEVYPEAWIECDVAMTADSVLFLLHDWGEDALNRTTTGSGSFDDLTWAQLSALFLRDSEGAQTVYHPTLFRDALVWAYETGVMYSVDDKPSADPARVAREIGYAKMTDHVIIITDNPAHAAAYFNANPALTLQASATSMKDLEPYSALGLPKSQYGVFIADYPRGDSHQYRDFIAALHSLEIRVTFGALINLDIRAGTEGWTEYLPYLDDGIDILATDRPDLVSQAIVEFNEAPVR